MIGINPVRYNDIKRGVTVPSEDMVNKIYTVFGELGVVINERVFERIRKKRDGNESYIDIWEKSYPVSSFNEEAYFFVMHSADSPERNLILKDKKLAINRSLLKLTPREKQVIEMYFGFNEEIEKTLEEIGDYLQLTRERARQIKEKAIRKLNHPSRSKNLRDYL